MIPIFIIVKDRTTVLKQSMESYQNLIKSPIEIILLDQESTYPGMIDFLKQKEKEGMKVIYLKNTKPVGNSMFPAIRSPIYQICQEMSVRYYVLTDPDIMFEKIDGDILEFYTFFMENNPGFDAIGPMLEIDDIPDYYPFKAEALKRHKLFWDATGDYALYGPPKPIQYKEKTISYQVAPIDTTFALRDIQKRKFCWTSNAVRTRKPYTAKHLDWYIDPNNITEDQKYYIDTADTHCGISHWGGTWLNSSKKFRIFKEKNKMPEKR